MFLKMLKLGVDVLPDWTLDCLDWKYLLNLPRLPIVLVKLKQEFSAISVWNPAVIRSGGNQTHEWWEDVLCIFENYYFCFLGWPVLWASDGVHSSEPHFSSLRRNPVCVSRQRQQVQQRPPLPYAEDSYTEERYERGFFPLQRSLISRRCWVFDQWDLWSHLCLLKSPRYYGIYIVCSHKGALFSSHLWILSCSHHTSESGQQIQKSKTAWIWCTGIYGKSLRQILLLSLIK